MPINIPNILTIIRLALIPVFVIAFYLPFEWANLAAVCVFLAAAITDYWDGYLARRLNQTTKFGAFVDPVADKLVVAAALVLLVAEDPRAAIALPVMITIGREITISALREWMAELGQRATVAVSRVGKFKTAAQMTAIAWMLYRDPIGPLPIYELGVGLLYVSAVLTLWSMYKYLRAAWPVLREG